MVNNPQWLNIIIRSFFLLVVLFLLTKWLGKRQLSQLSFFEYINGITIGSIAAEVSTGLETNFLHGFYSMLIWAAAPFFIGIISLKNKKARNFFEGKATVFIKDGKVLEDNLKKEKYTIDELLQLLRKKQVFNISEIEFAVLEANGELNVLLKKENQPLTPKDIGLLVAPQKATQTVIMDGEILDEPLSECGQNRGWLNIELDKLGVSLENVFLGQVDSFGKLTVDVYNDKIQVPENQEKPMLLASLKKCQADLELFSLQTDSKNAQAMYENNAIRLQRILEKVTYLIKD